VESLGLTPTSEASCHSSNSQDDVGEKRKRVPTSYAPIKNWLSAIKGIFTKRRTGIEERRDIELGGPNIVDYQNFIENSKAYQWLLSEIKRQTLSNTHGPDLKLEIGKMIRNRLSEHIPLRKATRQNASFTMEVTFHLEWDIRLFFREQEYNIPANQVLDSILCLTGTWQEAQGATVAEYLEQTWPVSHVPLRTTLQKFLACSENISGIGNQVILYILWFNSDPLGSIL
jgi:hypothetical protein